jgi:hypothetical protein
MTSTPSENNLQQLGTHATCNNIECQYMQVKYMAVYEKYVEQLQRVQALTHENELLAFDTRHKIAFLDLNKRQLGQMVEHQTLLVDSLRHRAPVDGGSVCDGCAPHRAALETLRALNASNYPNVKANQEEGVRILEACREELRAEKLTNARLRVRIGVNADSFWKDREVLQLREEVDRHRALCCEANKEVDRLKREVEGCRRGLRNAEHLIEMLESQVVSISVSGAKRKADELTMDEGLRSRLDAVFSITSDDVPPELEENALYDAFRATVCKDELDDCFDSMYAACHAGEKLPPRERRLLAQGGARVCKGPFGACLRALGGRSRKRGTLTVWTNVGIKGTTAASYTPSVSPHGLVAST